MTLDSVPVDHSIDTAHRLANDHDVIIRASKCGFFQYLATRRDYLQRVAYFVEQLIFAAHNVFPRIKVWPSLSTAPDSQLTDGCDAAHIAPRHCSNRAITVTLLGIDRDQIRDLSNLCFRI